MPSAGKRKRNRAARHAAEKAQRDRAFRLLSRDKTFEEVVLDGWQRAKLHDIAREFQDVNHRSWRLAYGLSGRVLKAYSQSKAKVALLSGLKTVKGLSNNDTQKIVALYAAMEASELQDREANAYYKNLDRLQRQRERSESKRSGKRCRASPAPSQNSSN
ncbi:hypothetical protein WJX73_001128 [Symbiochloris irregularis]|uniref:Uncharacterized protein n=1 Tax=Symbiochloris irregularis TaxID=706552 RepID=A0AAW1PJC9_9CHLO